MRNYLVSALFLLASFAASSCKNSNSNNDPTPEEMTTSTDEINNYVPAALRSEQPSWFSMRNDCGGESYLRRTDLFDMQFTGGLAFSYAKLDIGFDKSHSQTGSMGSISGEANQAVCKMLDFYFNQKSEVWLGRNYKNAFAKGDKVQISPRLDIDFRDSVKIYKFSDYTAKPDSLNHSEADALKVQIHYVAQGESQSARLIENIPMELNCSTKLKYEVFALKTKMPQDINEANYCRLLSSGQDVNDDAECLKLDPWLCHQSRGADGTCSEGPARPTLDTCTYTIPLMPLIDFSGRIIGNIKLAGYLFQVTDPGNPTQGAYRMTLNRIEVIR